MIPFCRAQLNYVPRSGPLRPAPVEVEIRDGRSSALPGWRSCGFEVVPHASSVRDWADDGEVAAVHYPEIEELIRRLTGCDAALVSDHVRRRADAQARGRDQAPVRLVHSDFAANYEAVARAAYRGVQGRGAATLARNGVSAEDLERAPRIAVLQVWRNLGGPRMDLPLAFCDARTVRPEEGRPFRYEGYVAGGRAFDALAIVDSGTSGDHHWYTFPDLTPRELVVFRTYDTDLVKSGSTWFTPHSAFQDPLVGGNPPSRFSIELRATCIYTAP